MAFFFNAIKCNSIAALIFLFAAGNFLFAVGRESGQV